MKTDQKLVRLENHAGRHGSLYHQEIKARLDRAWQNLRGKSQRNAKKALGGVVDQIIKDIESGRLRPYRGKNVRVVQIVLPKNATPQNHAFKRSRSGRLKGFWIIDVLSIIPGTKWEVGFIRGRMEAGESFSGAVHSLWEYYDAMEIDYNTYPPTYRQPTIF